MPGPLHFKIVHKVLSRDFRNELPWDLLYADDLVLVVDLTACRIQRRSSCGEEGMESTGLRVNTSKMTLIISRIDSYVQQVRGSRWSFKPMQGVW